MKRIAVFCGSSSGNDPEFESQAYALGAFLASQNIGLVYGGSKLGLMGATAYGFLDHDGEAIGVLPTFLAKKEIAHPKLTEIHLVESMHERKAMMNELSDGVIALPGGFGTLEELFEMLTWAQLGLHQKPIGILNLNGYYDELVSFFDTMVDKKLLKPEYRQMVVVDSSFEALFAKMQAYQAPTVTKWITKDKT